MSFKVGDVVEIVGYFHHPERLGMVGTVVGGQAIRETIYGEKLLGYQIDIPGAVSIPGSNGLFQYPAQHLRLKRPPSKDDAEPRADFTPGEWELCPWKPNTVKA
jgi:hypothetical protein